MTGRGIFIIICGTLLVAGAIFIFYHYAAPPEHGENNSNNNTRIDVVVTILPAMDFVKHVGGDRVRVTVIVPPGVSPHIYEPRPEQLKQASTAKLYFMVGSGMKLEQNLVVKIRAINPDIKIVNISKGVTIIENDPHVWNAPANAKLMVENICEALVQIDPGHAEYYINNANAYSGELDALDYYFHRKLDQFDNRAFLAYHPAFGYLAMQYNLTQIAVERGGKEPTARAIKDCIDLARRYNLHYVFVAPQFTTVQCEAIAREIGGEIAPMDPLPANYTANMRQIADLLAEEFADS